MKQEHLLYNQEEKKFSRNRSRVDRDVGISGSGLPMNFYKFIPGFNRKCGHYVWTGEESKQGNGNHKKKQM